MTSSGCGAPRERSDGVERRAFLVGAAVAGLAAATGSASCSEDSVPQSAPPTQPAPPAGWRSAGPVDGLRADAATARTAPLVTDMQGGSRTVLVYLRLNSAPAGAEPEVLAFSSRCTHRGCPVRYVPRSDRFICPCHGAIFGPDGRLLGGPAPRPLDRYRALVHAGTVYIEPGPPDPA